MIDIKHLRKNIIPKNKKELEDALIARIDSLISKMANPTEKVSIAVPLNMKETIMKEYQSAGYIVEQEDKARNQIIISLPPIDE